jgi:predicted NACHT family NTPase
LAEAEHSAAASEGIVVLRRRRKSVAAALPAPRGVILGRRLSGGGALPACASGVVWPFERMRRHAVILGASGSGKTETSMRIAHELASKTLRSFISTRRETVARRSGSPP